MSISMKRGTAGIDEEIKITNKRKKHRPAVIDDSLSCAGLRFVSQITNQ